MSESYEDGETELRSARSAGNHEGDGRSASMWLVGLILLKIGTHIHVPGEAFHTCSVTSPVSRSIIARDARGDVCPEGWLAGWAANWPMVVDSHAGAALVMAGPARDKAGNRFPARYYCVAMLFGGD